MKKIIKKMRNHKHLSFVVVVLLILVSYAGFYAAELKTLVFSSKPTQKPMPVPGIMISAVKDKTSESGEVGLFKLRLKTKPKHEVVIPLSSSNPSEGKVVPEFLRFTPTNWYVARTVGVVGIHDKIPDGNQEYYLEFGTIASKDTDYSELKIEPLKFLNVGVFTQQLGTPEPDSGKGIALDGSGNVYLVGTTGGSLGNNPFHGETDLFLAKYRPDGQVLWVRQLGSLGTETGDGVVVAPTGDIFVTGTTTGRLGDDLPQGASDLILAKYNSEGELQWLRQKGTLAQDEVSGMAMDHSGNLILVGTTLGRMEGQTYQGEKDAFLMKFDLHGQWRWTHQIGTDKDDLGSGIAVDAKDQIYIVGSTSGALQENHDVGGFDVFVLKCEPSGTIQWVQQLGTPKTDYGLAITVSNSGEVYVSGSTEGDLVTGTVSPKGEMFVIKLAANAEKQWIRQLGAPETYWGLSAYGIVYNAASGDVFVTGEADAPLEGQPHYGGPDIVVVKYNAHGEKKWVRQIGTGARDHGYGIALDSAGDVYITGDAWGRLDGNIHQGLYDIILVRYTAEGVKY
ncbi:SBBP repeat-containing protein [Deltaproteobacteria bacterium TL4]